ncbi:hypothetical protein MMC25_000196 [Agyrium rufum]|nr:hypothetical protein [Agyrium rufum]
MDKKPKEPAVPPQTVQLRGCPISIDHPVPVKEPSSVGSKPAVLDTDTSIDEWGFPLKRRRPMLPKDNPEKAEEDEDEEEEDQFHESAEHREEAESEAAVQANGENSRDVSSHLKATEAEKSEPNGVIPTERSNELPRSTPSPKPTDSVEIQESSTEPKSPKTPKSSKSPMAPRSTGKEAKHALPTANGGVSEWSHQMLAPKPTEGTDGTKDEEDEWQDMPAYGKYDVFDDDGNLVARGATDADIVSDNYAGLGGAGKGYTRVQIDDDAQSATSMDENTSYLFKEKSATVIDEDEDQRDPLAQMQATKDMLTEGQRIAYVGVVRLAMIIMSKEVEKATAVKAVKKDVVMAVESMQRWSQKMMVRLYGHMEISSSEQVMIEQLAEHGVQSGDLTPALMLNARVKNPMADESIPSRPSLQPPTSPQQNLQPRSSNASPTREDGPDSECPSPPAYELHKNEDLPEAKDLLSLPTTRNLDIDIRWTILCDLFLVLIADSVYDSRSRVLLEKVGASLEVPWIDICRFEKRVTDALEMQEAAVRETWDEAEHMENRRKLALKRKYMMMGLATVGGTLVIGLSAGLLAPVIGAGLAAGFTTIGVAGTSGFLAGAGGTALITTGAALSGGTVAIRASNRRMGAVKTFEYRPLHNKKRVNLIITISGWMNGKIDDVRLPFSTVDPMMGDMYSILWEPDMLQSMGDTIRILATEALTQGLQQVLASTILTALMASLTLPIWLTKLSYLIDNPWAVSMDRANAAGLILADSLIDRNLGVRPITLVGFSLGARVIFSCLRELANKGAYGIVQNVYLFGSPVVANKDQYLRAKTVVAGRFVNGYAANDWILGYLFRATTGGISRVAGLAPIENVPGIENVDFTHIVAGHMAYRGAMPRLLREVGWEVESDEFGEIEDPDPENHEGRQRELIREIDEARAQAQANSGKKRFGFFKMGKAPAKKSWETYDERSKAEPEGQKSQAGTSSGGGGGVGGVLFDVDAIRAELEAEHMEVRQLESTLPPMKLDLKASRSRTDHIPSQASFSDLRHTRSLDGTSPSLSVPQREPSPVSNHGSVMGNENPFQNGNYEYDVYDDKSGGHSPISPPNGVAKMRSSFEPMDETAYMSPPRTSTSISTVFSPTTSIRAKDPSPQRPIFSHSVTTPIPQTTGLGIEHNAWLDEEDEFGREKDMKLSFE